MTWWYGVLRAILDLPAPASTFAPDVDRLHFFVIGTTMVGFVVVAAVTVVALLRFRADGPIVPVPQKRNSPLVEGGVIGTTLFLFLLWFGLGFATYVRIETPPAGALDVYVTAKQWMWKFVYGDGTGSIGVLVVPKDRPVRLVMTSRDVIHSFAVPPFRIKQDVIPGRYTTAWFEATEAGTFPIWCSEYCGFDHSQMTGWVVVLPPDEYAAWLDASVSRREASAPVEASAPSLASAGRDVASSKGCFQCHSVDGTRQIGPTWVGLYGSLQPLSDGTNVLADEPYLTESMMDPMAKVVQGFSPVMPTYQGKLTPTEVASILAYMRSISSPGAAIPSAGTTSGGSR